MGRAKRCCMQTVPKLLYMAKGLKNGWYHQDDVMAACGSDVGFHFCLRA